MRLRGGKGLCVSFIFVISAGAGENLENTMAAFHQWVQKDENA